MAMLVKAHSFVDWRVVTWPEAAQSCPAPLHSAPARASCERECGEGERGREEVDSTRRALYFPECSRRCARVTATDVRTSNRVRGPRASRRSTVLRRRCGRKHTRHVVKHLRLFPAVTRTATNHARRRLCEIKPKKQGSPYSLYRKGRLLALISP
eukprot:1758180-Rhodomonas_salina.2